MKIFISWSGQRSKVVAELVSDWIKCVIQTSQPWISTRDIDRGAIWFSEINDKLKDTSVGIVCLTQENKNKPWILFETGALAKGLTTNRVCTLLVDLQPADLVDPLAQFNHTLPNKQGIWELVRTINGCQDEQFLDERILDQVFTTYWPQFESRFKQALEDNKPQVETPPRSEQDLLTEILNNTRSLSSRVRELESSMNYSNKKNTSLSYSELDKKLISKILNMLKQGITDDEKIANSLIDYDMPEKYALDLVRKVKSESGFKIDNP